MRVLLVGRPKDRDRLRAELIAAGIEIVAESASEPDAGSALPNIDAVIHASPRQGNAREDDEIYVEPLTARELEVLALMADGLSNKAIAQALGISDQTSKFHVAAIIRKLGAANRTEAVRRAIRRGLVAI